MCQKKINISGKETDNNISYPFKFSIVTAVYNAEKYIAETIESVLNQTLGFEKNIQIILVNDGSSDNSGGICDDYAKKHPNNITVIHKENGGVASARNAGIQLAEGRYINFLDSDDKFSKNALYHVYNFFKKNTDKTDVVTIPMVLFDGQTGEHWQNYKFENGTRLANLNTEYTVTNMTTSASFFKNELKPELVFDSSLATGEDMKAILGVLYHKMTMGLVTQATYYYRKVSGGSSLVQSSTQKKSWYLNFVPHLVQWAYDFYIDKLGFFPAFVQYELLCDFQWRILEEATPAKVLTHSEYKQYIKTAYSALLLFEDKFILEQKLISPEMKLYVLRKKYNEKAQLIKNNSDINLSVKGNTVFSQSELKVFIDFITLSKDELILEGYALFPSQFKENNCSILVKANDVEVNTFYINRNLDIFLAGEQLLFSKGFKCSITLNNAIKNYTIEIYSVINGLEIRQKNLEFSLHCPITNKIPFSNYTNFTWSISAKYSSIHCSTYSKKAFSKNKLHFLANLFFREGMPGKKALFARIGSKAYSILNKNKQIYLISDRVSKANDNGEALFKYINTLKNKQIKSYYCINKNTTDYMRLSKEYKNVISFKGWKYKFLLLQGAYIISSQAEDYIYNPFNSYGIFYLDMLAKTKRIFLQHGIIMNDLSDWLNRYNKNFNLLCATTQSEYQSLLSYNYYYDKQQIKLTGLARYDLLYNDNKGKKITIMPTWREYLMSDLDVDSGNWALSSTFTKSNYFIFYNSLINNENLLNSAKHYGYSIRFMPHPTLIPHMSTFENSGDIEFIFDTPYKQIFAESSLLVTDYSSIAFDFAYLKKPVIYCQFDADSFFSGAHVAKKGYYSYEDNGFGEIEYNLENTVNRIIEYMKNNCKIKENYLERIKATFAFTDNSNCSRIMKEISKL